MSDHPPKPEATAHFDEHVLLEQGAWVRRLARGLVSDEAAAEDLSQDVMMAALSKSPGLDGAQLRGWLATVARRLAGRGHERNATRRHTERSVARHETEDRGVSRRLELHRQLTGAVERLDEPYRTALVLRYFESLPPREIAERLSITPTAARKRVSRGLSSLREDLDSEFGDRQAWLAAFAPLAFPFKKAAPLAGGTSLLALAKTKLALVAGVACFAGLVYLYTPFFESSPPVDGLEVWGGVPVSLLAQGDSPLAPDPGTPTSKALTADPLRTPVAAAPALGPRVRIVDADGAFPAGTHAAWIDHFSQVHPLELDAQGTAPRPAGSTSARFFAHNPHAGNAVVVGGPEGEDALLVLSPGHALRGRVIEDGGPPSQPLFIEAFPMAHSLGLRTEEGDQCTLLEKSLAIQGASSTWTKSDGSFVFEGFSAETVGFLLLPSSHSYIGESETDTGGRINFVVGERELVVETTRYPTIQGRLVWADDRSPVTTLASNPGVVWSRVSAPGSPKGPVRYGRIDQDGQFTIGVEEFGTTVDRHSRPELLLTFGLTSETKGPARESMALFSQRLSIDGQRLPLDLGTIEIERPLTASFHVIDAAGEPVEGATLATTLGSTKSNAQGFATLPCRPGHTVRAIRQGYSVGELVLGNQLPPPGESLTLRLEPGVEFSIDLGPNPNALFRIELAWDVSPFQGIALDGPGPFEPFPAHLMFALHGVPAPGGKWKTRTPGAPGTIRLFLPPSGRVELPGMRPRSSFTVRLLDSLAQPLVEHKVSLPAAGGSLELELLPSGGSSLEIRLVDTDGRPIEDGRFVIIATGDQPLEPSQRPTYVWKKGFDCPGGSYTIEPLVPGTFTISATTDGELEATLTDYVVNTPHQVLELTLEPR